MRRGNIFGLLSVLLVVAGVLSCNGDSQSSDQHPGDADVEEDIHADLPSTADGDATTDSDATTDGAVDGDDVDDVDEGETAFEVVEDNTPPEIIFTVNELPDYLNGSIPYTLSGGDGPYEFMLHLPTSGFTLDLLTDEPISGLDQSQLDVRCNQPIGPDEDIAEEADLSSYFEWSAERVRWLVPEELAFPISEATCRGRVADLSGNLSEWSSVTFLTRIQTADYHPFDPPDEWVITFSRDNFDIWFEYVGGRPTLQSEPIDGGDGEADFTEDLRAIGLQGLDNAEGADTVVRDGVTGASAIVREWVISETLVKMREFFGLDPQTGSFDDPDAIRITLHREDDAGAPDPEAFDETFSIMAVGGDSPPGETGLFGRAFYDVNNRNAENVSGTNYGVFSTNLFRQVIDTGAGMVVLKEFQPGWGVPIGESEFDAIILADSFDPELATSAEAFRYDELVFVIDMLTKALASLVVHEMGHSLGLVACGPPPEGLFSGMFIEEWMVIDPGCGHIDPPGLNIMQPGSSLMVEPTAIMEEVFWAPLNLAYLRGRLIVNQ